MFLAAKSERPCAQFRIGCVLGRVFESARKRDGQVCGARNPERFRGMERVRVRPNRKSGFGHFTSSRKSRKERT